VAGKTKLELTWIGKDEREKLEPRVLIEDEAMGHSCPAPDGSLGLRDNILIKGDNLLALKALEAEGRFKGSVKVVYIDPPYNINAAQDNYDDGLEHSIWLSLLRDRIELIYRLMTDDGVFFTQIDDREMPYLTVLCDEIFGRKNRINIVAVKMSEASGLKMSHVGSRLPKFKEFVLVYKKGGSPKFNIEKIPAADWNDEYKTVLLGIDREKSDRLKELMGQDTISVDEASEANSILEDGYTQSISAFFKAQSIAKAKQKDWKYENAWRIIQAVGSSSVLRLAKDSSIADQEIAAARASRGGLALHLTGFDHAAKQPRIQVIFADQHLMVHPGDFWSDIRTTGGVGQEGGMTFPKGKKPEALIKRLIQMVSNPGDLVLDSFAGSGTTGAVAHKMGRRWIMVELGDHAETHIVPRLNKVIDGQDPGGVTEATGWKGGGGYRYFHLAPSLLEKDQWGQYVISKEYKPEMLAEAVSKLMGFTYAPSQDYFWRHGHSTENDYIYVTTQRLTHDALRKLSHEVGEGRTLLVCCRAHDENTFDNLTVRKIPHAVMAKCEWGRDDYSLNIQEAPSEPITESDLDDDDTVEAAE